MFGGRSTRHPNAPPPAAAARLNNNHRSSRRSRYRSSRSVAPSHGAASLAAVQQWTHTKVLLLCGGTLLLAFLTLSPVVLLESFITNDDNHNKKDGNTSKQKHSMVGLGALLQTSEQVREQWHQALRGAASFQQENQHQGLSGMWHSLLRAPPVPEEEHAHFQGQELQEEDDYNSDGEKEKEDAADEIDEEDLKTTDANNNNNKKNTDQGAPSASLGRGVSGLPPSKTPALLGAQRGHLHCLDATEEYDSTMDDMVYWNDPQGTRDVQFISPFAGPKQQPPQGQEKFLTFEPDPGGWNNVRMSMEIMFVLAAATDRTLVLPPKQPFYLLGMGEQGARSFGDYFDIETVRRRIKVISMEEFVQKHAKTVLGWNETQMQQYLPLAKLCVLKPGSDKHCDLLAPSFREKGFQPEINAQSKCLVFDEEVFSNNDVSIVSEELKKRVDRFCGKERTPVYYTSELHDPVLIHWQAAGDLKYRLLNHFYTFFYFTNPVIDNYFKRFVRDLLHYNHEIFCTAGKIVHALGAFSSLHVRRGDLQYKEVKIPAEDLYNNTKELWQPGELLYIATDERNKTFFDPFKKHHPIKKLDDFWDMAGLGKLDPTYLGMIDTIVASHGRAFAGTWFSTFTGYINRIRGYYGKSMKDSWYSYLPRKSRMQEWQYPNGNYVAREWPIGWVGIDGDEWVEHEGDVPLEDMVKSNRKLPKISVADLVQDDGFRSRALARGIAGRPKESTPALDGGSRAHIECDINVDSLAYWNNPQGTRDVNFVSPFAVKGDTRYISFLPDRGGWNNVRMSMEIIFVIAAASGRTLVLPPEINLYLLHHDKGKRQRGFADFFPLHTAEFQKRVPVISFEEFVRREGGKDGRLPVPEELRKRVTKAAKHCENRKISDSACEVVSQYLISVAHVPSIRAQNYCVVFDKEVYDGRPITPEHEQSVHDFCGDRKIAYWDSKIQENVLVHFRAGEKEYRLLTHFYNMLHFSDPSIDHYFKRFVRDFLHYHDSIYCAAGKIVKALQLEGQRKGFTLDDDNEGGGGYAALHIRRGDFQYKKVKIPASEWYANTQELWKPNEILYIATDERNKTFFDPITVHHPVRFLDDYWDLAGLGDLDPNYMGMIDTIVASRARAFAGTWFSTFSGYINRMRGHHGMSMKNSWYSFLDRKTAMHEWKNVSTFAYAYEWPSGWVGIDADASPLKDKF